MCILSKCKIKLIKLFKHLISDMPIINSELFQLYFLLIIDDLNRNIFILNKYPNYKKYNYICTICKLELEDGNVLYLSIYYNDIYKHNCILHDKFNIHKKYTVTQFLQQYNIGSHYLYLFINELYKLHIR